MSEWSSAVTRVPAELKLADGSVVRGDLHLQSRSRHGTYPETPLEFLNRDEAFFAVTEPDGGVAFVSRAQVAVITLPPHAEFEPPDRVQAAVALGLAITMDGGAELRGRARAELPPDRTRTIDYLNAAGPFLALAADDAIRFVNRAYVRLVRPLQ